MSKPTVFVLTYSSKQVFIAQGSGVTADYITAKGSACIEVFCTLSHDVARYFGDSDISRKHKEIVFQEDIRVIIEDGIQKGTLVLTRNRAIPGHLIIIYYLFL